MESLGHFENENIFLQELNDELDNILHYWANNALDSENDGFKGRINENNITCPLAPKGSVLNARILWAFSAAYNFNGKSIYLDNAHRAYHYISTYFIDEQYGGVYWAIDCSGAPLDTKKQAYAIAFTIYGLAEYYKCSKDVKAKELAIRLYNTLINHFYEPKYGGYTEAFSKNWGLIEDIRLSEKDMHEKKTMNTHLHIMEAYTNLYRIWPDDGLKGHIVLLINIFLEKIIGSGGGQLGLFFDEAWNLKSSIISYGHDVEASWLLLEAAEVTGKPDLIRKVKIVSLKIATGAVEALDNDFGMWYEKNKSTGYWIKEKHWWVQAEAMVGFVNAWQISKQENFLNLAINNWQFVKKKIKDRKYGEWLWGVDEKGVKLTGQDKVGIWKCPYHNSRACIEILNRLK